MTENMASSSDDGGLDDSRKDEISSARNDSGNMASSRKQTDTNASFLRAARAGNLEKLLSYIDSGTDINASNVNGLNALHLASKEGHTQIVQQLLQRKAAVDAATKKGNTALHIAALAGQLDVVKILIGHGSKVNIQSQNGFTALYMAAQENHVEVVRYLLANVANQTLTTEDGFTPLAVALQQGHEKIVKLLLENDASGGKVHLPALHIAAKKDDIKAATLLLQNAHNVDKTSGFTPLHIAAHYGNVNVAHLLIQKGADVNFKARNSIVPLHVASKWGRSTMITVLLDANAVIDCQTRDGLTPLHCAARSGHDQVIDLLLERGAPVTAKTKNGLSPLHMAVQGDHIDCIRLLLLRQASINEVTVDYLTPLHVAAHCGNVKSAKLLLDRKCEVNARALNGFTPLHIACKKNRIKVVELLLKYGAMLEATTESGLTPMHVAAFMGHINIVLHFIQHGACIDSTTVRGETALHLAARANQTDVMRVLLRNGAQVDAKARELQTALHIAARLGNIDNVSLLLKHGASPDAVTKDLYTALHIAAKEGHEEVALQLLEQGANHSLTTKKGFTALHVAAKHGQLRTARLLLKRGTEANVEGKNGLTPLHVATHYGHIAVALMLMENGANPCCVAKNGYTPLHISAKKNQMDMAPTLLDYGAKPNADSKNGFTPLHLAVQNGHVDMVLLLLERGAEVNWRAKNGLTPLHLAAQEDSVPIAEMLAKFDLQIDPHTKAGYTPLHTACHFGQINMIRFLLEHGANVNSKTKLDYTPLHHAAQQGHVQVVTLLIKFGASPDALSTTGHTPMSIAQRLGYLSVVEILRPVTAVAVPAPAPNEDKYRVISPEIMQEAPMSDSEDEGVDNIVEPSDQLFQYLSSGEMKILQDDSVALAKDDRDFYIIEHGDGKNSGSSLLSPRGLKDQVKYTNDEVEIVMECLIVNESAVSQFSASTAYDNVDRHSSSPSKLRWKSFLISFMVDARGGALHGSRHGGVRVVVPPGQALMPTRITCKLVRKERLLHPPPLMDGEALASRVLEMGPTGISLLGPVVIAVPHFASLRGDEREIAILRSDNGQTWREHTFDNVDDSVQELIDTCFDELKESEYQPGTMARIVTKDFPMYFAIITRPQLNTAVITPSGGVVSSKVIPQVQAVFPPDSVVRSIKVALQVVPVSPELVSRLLGSNRVAVSPLVTLEPRRRKFHQPVMLTVPLPKTAQRGMINQYNSANSEQSHLRLLCSVFGTDTFAYLAGDSSTVDHSPTKYRSGEITSVQWEDITNSTPLSLVNDCVSFTTNISARFWLVDCQNVYDAVKMASELYEDLVAVPFLSKFVVFAKREDHASSKVRLFCMTDDKMDKTLEVQEQFTEIARSRDIEVFEDRPQYVEMSGNLFTLTKSGEQPFLMFHSFHENRLALNVKTRDPDQEPIGRVAFFREPRAARGDVPQNAICNLNIHLSDLTDWAKSCDTDEIENNEVDEEKIYPDEKRNSENKAPNSITFATYFDSNFDALKDEIGSLKELGSSRDSSMYRGVSLDVSYDEQDFHKESESIGDETSSEAGSVIEKEDFDKDEVIEDTQRRLASSSRNERLQQLDEEFSDSNRCQSKPRELISEQVLAPTTSGELSPDIARSDTLSMTSPKLKVEEGETGVKDDDTVEELTDRSEIDEWEAVDAASECNFKTESVQPCEELIIPENLPEPESAADVHCEPYESHGQVVERTTMEDSHEVRDDGYTIQRHVVKTQHLRCNSSTREETLIGIEVNEEVTEIDPRVSSQVNKDVDIVRMTEQQPETFDDGIWMSHTVTHIYVNPREKPTGLVQTELSDEMVSGGLLDGKHIGGDLMSGEVQRNEVVTERNERDSASKRITEDAMRQDELAVEATYRIENFLHPNEVVEIATDADVLLQDEIETKKIAAEFVENVLHQEGVGTGEISEDNSEKCENATENNYIELDEDALHQDDVEPEKNAEITAQFVKNVLPHTGVGVEEISEDNSEKCENATEKIDIELDEDVLHQDEVETENATDFVEIVLPHTEVGIEEISEDNSERCENAITKEVDSQMAENDSDQDVCDTKITRIVIHQDKVVTEKIDDNDFVQVETNKFDATIVGNVLPGEVNYCDQIEVITEKTGAGIFENVLHEGEDESGQCEAETERIDAGIFENVLHEGEDESGQCEAETERIDAEIVEDVLHEGEDDSDQCEAETERIDAAIVEDVLREGADESDQCEDESDLCEAETEKTDAEIFEDVLREREDESDTYEAETEKIGAEIVGYVSHQERVRTEEISEDDSHKCEIETRKTDTEIVKNVLRQDAGETKNIYENICEVETDDTAAEEIGDDVSELETRAPGADEEFQSRAQTETEINHGNVVTADLGNNSGEESVEFGSESMEIADEERMPEEYINEKQLENQEIVEHLTSVESAGDTELSSSGVCHSSYAMQIVEDCSIEGHAIECSNGDNNAEGCLISRDSEEECKSDAKEPFVPQVSEVQRNSEVGMPSPKLENFEQLTPSAPEETFTFHGLSIPQIDLQAASPLAQSPSSENEFWTTNSGTTWPTMQGNEECYAENHEADDGVNIMENEQMQHFKTDDSDTEGHATEPRLEMREQQIEDGFHQSETTNSVIGTDFETSSDIQQQLEYVKFSLEENTTLAISALNEADEVLVETRAHRAQPADELEDRFQAILTMESPTDSHLSAFDQSDRRDSTNSFEDETFQSSERGEGSEQDTFVHVAHAIELEEVAEDTIEPLRKESVALTENHLEQLSDAYPQQFTLSTLAPETEIQDTHAGEELHGDNEDEEAVEGHLTGDTSIENLNDEQENTFIESTAGDASIVNEAQEDSRQTESTLGGIALGFDEEELRDVGRLDRFIRTGGMLGIMDPRSPEPSGTGPFSYASDLHFSDLDKSDPDYESVMSFPNQLEDRVTLSSPRCLVESPLEQVSPTNEIGLKDILSPVLDIPPTVGRKKMPIGSSPSCFILEEDEEEEEELERAGEQRGYFRPIVETTSSDQIDSELEESDHGEELDDQRGSDTETPKENEDGEQSFRGDEEGESHKESSPFEFVTSADIPEFADDEDRCDEVGTSDATVQRGGLDDAKHYPGDGI